MRALIIVVLGSMLAFTSAMAQTEVSSSAAATAESVDSAAAEADSISESINSVSTDEEKDGPHQYKENPCKKMNTTAEQKEKIKAAMTELKTSSKDLRIQLRAAYKNLSTVVNDANSDAAAASAALDALNSTQDSLRSSLQASKLNVLYSILNADQRAAGFACLEQAKKNKGERRGPPKPGQYQSPRQDPPHGSSEQRH